MKFSKKYLFCFILVLISLLTVSCNGGGGGNNPPPPIPLPTYSQVFTEKEMLYMAFLNYLDAHYGSAIIDLDLLKLPSGEFQVFNGNDVLVTFAGRDVIFYNNPTNPFLTDGSIIVGAEPGPIDIQGTIIQPSLGVNTQGAKFFPIVFYTIFSTQELGAIIKGEGRVVDDFFHVTYDPNSYLDVFTYTRSTLMDQGYISAPSNFWSTLFYGDFVLDYHTNVSSNVIDRATAYINVYAVPTP